MEHLYASVALGTAAMLLAAVLLLLRLRHEGRRPIVALARRWAMASTLTSVIVLAAVSAIAVASFANVVANTGAVAPSSGTAASASLKTASRGGGESLESSQALDALRAYADTIDDTPKGAAAPAAQNAVELPAVDTMIAKLIARLDKQPDDVKGWKMLGWSHLNMGRPAEAARAYETALKLDSGDIEIKKGLEAANAAQGAASPAGDQVTGTEKAPDALSDDQRGDMIRGMVDQLAARLEQSPNDEEGWLRLMRSRVTLGDKESARTALAKALDAFANDAPAKDRITAAARDLGVASGEPPRAAP